MAKLILLIPITKGDQLAINVGSNTALEVSGIGAWKQGEPDSDGYFTFVASGGLEWQENDGLEGELALTRQGCQMAKFDPFLSLDCARVEGVGAQSKERKGSNFAA